MLDRLPGSVRAFLEATNAADAEAFVAAFAPDARLDDWGRVYTGREGIEAWDQTDNIGVHAHFEVIGVEYGAADDPDALVVVLSVTGNGYNGSTRMTFRLRDGLIADLLIA